MTSLFGHSVRSDLLLLYVADALLCFLAVCALLIWQGDLPVEQGGMVAVTIAITCGLISGASGLYRPEALGRARQLIVGTIVASVLLLVLLPLLTLVSPSLGASLRSHLVGVTLAFIGAVLTTRIGFTAVVRSGITGRRLALIRDPVTDISRLSTVVSNGNFAVPFDVDANSSLSERLDPVKLQAAKVKTAVVAGGVAIPDVVRRSCEASGIRVLTEEEFLERQLARVNIERLPADWVSSANVARESKAETVLRRIFDILLGAFLLLATLPLLLLTALAIKLDSRGPVFYRQERVGLNGQSFMLFKFRSMRTDAEAGGTAIWASKQDPRVTRIGRFLRLTRIDEIPQVLNVLRGDMAFVGPRPERPAFVEQLGRIIPHYKDRALVKPGITGWAQVNYPYGASVEDARMKLAYDLYYVRRRSLFLDMLILVSTVRVVLFQEGAR